MTQDQQYWQSALQKWAASGLSQAEFCRQNHIKLNRFYAWKSKLQATTSTVSSESQPFIELSRVVTSIESAPLVLKLHGIAIHYDQATCPELLIRLLKLLREEL